jgi:alpha-ribazole phosphatase
MEMNKGGRIKDSSPADLRIQRNPVKRIDMELVLVRHGHTQWNKERRYLGSTDLPLLPEEREKCAGLRMQPELAGDFWRVYCSDLRRCRETLAAVAPHLERQTIYDSRLREMNFGAWEGCNYGQLKDNRHYRSWIDHPETVTPPEGESWRKFEARLEDLWAHIEQAAELEDCWQQTLPPEQASQNPSESRPLRVLLVTHGGIIRQLLSRMTEGVTFYTAAAPAPGVVTVLNLRREEGVWRNIKCEEQLNLPDWGQL